MAQEQIGEIAHEVNTSGRTYNYFTLKIPAVASTFTPQAMWFM